jgi:ketosteroid isomerase-like protein
MDLEATIQQLQRAAVEFAKGNPAPVKAIFSHRDDVVLANPFGPAVKGWNNVSAALDLASSRFCDGDVTAFETIASYRTDGLACFHEVERWRAKVAGGSDIACFDLRVTSTYRREGDDWKLVLRHADTITTPQPADAVVRR